MSSDNNELVARKSQPVYLQPAVDRCLLYLSNCSRLWTAACSTYRAAAGCGQLLAIPVELQPAVNSCLLYLFNCSLM